MTRTSLPWLALISLAASACTFDTSGVTPGNRVDASGADALTPDGPPGDGGAVPDARVSDAMIPPDAYVPRPPTPIGYWRMEADADFGVPLAVVNQLNGGQPRLVAPGTTFLSVDVPVSSIPKTGALNTLSLAHNGAMFLDGSIEYQSQFDVRSIGVEFWARNTEASATFFDRSDNILNDGLRIDSPNNLRVRYHVDNGAGGSMLVTLIPGGVVVDGTWRHYAFTYDEATGMGCVYVDGVLRGACNDGADNRPLVWLPNTNIQIGADINGDNLAGAVIDEVRVWDGAPAPSEFLVSPP